ncbi:subtilisin-like protein [Wolfiporia cocos MD-104 SS10]|uniref:tripeptidyl-peptidase II n=1 Tax=Wolfiporia cocos (strain MD-104) TaxID=742152 RepID=A0A2H3JY50_WOLCO|nr:subtilisin-like protein [Wolfiporia cocos MD-104 SS10]
MKLSLVVVLLVSVALGKPAPRSMRVLGRRDSPPSSYTLLGAASSDTQISLRIALAQSNPTGLEEALYDVSTPSSTNYGQHLTKEEAAQFVAPTSETRTAVTEWLEASGVNATTLTPAGDWLGFTISVSQANELFDADYSVFVHDTTGKQTIRTLSYSVPEELQGHITVVYPTTTFPTYKPRSPNSPAGAPLSQRVPRAESGAIDPSCANAITPSCLQAIYGIPTTPATQSSNRLGVAGYDDQWANTADLQTFLKTYRPDMSYNTTFSLQTLDGGTNNQTEADAGVEANLDIQYTVGLATDVPVIFISAGDDNHDGDLGGFLDMTELLLNEDSPPQVWTTSYGPNEDQVPIDLAYNLCNAYAQLGARGVSILFASGDGGVSGGWQATGCTDFVVAFPDGCPYMTNVGSTTGFDPEVGAWFSAGGFSNYWSRPAYQEAAVITYLAYLGDTYDGLYNASGRAYPDVATQGINFAIVADQQTELVDGTSCSSPTFASVISLLNDELASVGKPPLGFLNPWLYSIAAAAFNDITSGNNPGCNTTGFQAIVGWDPVTGLGTPNYELLRVAAGL